MKILLAWYGILAVSLVIIGMACMNTVNGIDVVEASHTMDIRTNLVHDPWMTASMTGVSGKPIHSIDGSSTRIFVASTTDSMNQDVLDQWERQNGVLINSTGHYITNKTESRGSWDNYLGGVPMASLNSNSFYPGGAPALKTTDPVYLAMGARSPVDNSYLPEILRN